MSYDDYEERQDEYWRQVYKQWDAEDAAEQLKGDNEMTRRAVDIAHLTAEIERKARSDRVKKRLDQIWKDKNDIQEQISLISCLSEDTRQGWTEQLDKVILAVGSTSEGDLQKLSEKITEEGGELASGLRDISTSLNALLPNPSPKKFVKNPLLSNQLPDLNLDVDFSALSRRETAARVHLLLLQNELELRNKFPPFWDMKIREQLLSCKHLLAKYQTEWINHLQNIKPSDIDLYSSIQQLRDAVDSERNGLESDLGLISSMLGVLESECMLLQKGL